MIQVANNVTHDAQRAIDNQLIWGLIINLSLGALFLILFLLIRPCIKSVFGLNPHSKFPKSIVSWIPPLLKRTDDQIINSLGLDVFVTLMVLKYFIYMTIAYAIYGLLVTLPVDATASGSSLPLSDPSSVTGLSVYSISNIIPRVDGSRYWAHLVAVLWNTVVTLFCMKRMWQIYTQHRRKLFATPRPHNYSVCVSRLYHSQSHRDLYEYFDRIFPGEVVRATRTPSANNIVNEKYRRMRYVNQLEYAKKKGIRRTYKIPRTLDFCLGCGDYCFCKEKVDAERYYEKRISRTEAHIRAKQKTPSYSSVAYVTFKNISTAMQCAQLRFDIGSTRGAPEINDVRWMNHGFSYRLSTMWSWIAHIVIFFLFIFWSALIATATSFANLNTLSIYLPFLKDVNQNLKSVIGAILPALIILLCFSLLKLIVYYAMDLTGPLSHSKLDRDVFKKLFLFYVINVFLVSVLANTFLETWRKILAYTTDLSIVGALLLVAKNVGIQSPFFMNYILTISLTQVVMLLHPIDILYRLWARTRAVTERDKLRAKLPFHYPIQIDLVQHCLVFLMTITFSAIAPLVLPFGLVYLCIVYFSMSFETAYTSLQDYDGFGSIFPVVSNRILCCLLIAQFLMGGMFLLSQFYVGLAICIILFFASIACNHYTFKPYHAIAKFGMVEDVVGPELEHAEPEATETVAENENLFYVHPAMWDPKQDLEDITRLEYSSKLDSHERPNPP